MQLPYANLQLEHWNPGATAPLVLPVHVICNTSTEQIHDNIRTNSRACRNWQKLIDAHDGAAVICGSGPSLADTLDEVRALRDSGAKVFALNGAAAFLDANGIFPDYQVILDARAETASLVGPAKEHLFASQVHPDTLAKVPGARLWQLQVEGIDDLLPEHDGGYCLIGGAASVGNTATCLAYAMGFRTLELFGYDSSHRGGKGHAFRQSLNDGDPCAAVTFGGKEYTASLTMKLQAEKFMETSRALRQMGCAIRVHGSGLLPDMFHAPREVWEEQEKYEAMWKIPAYREHSPGEWAVETFLEVVKPAGVLVDFGCGTGRAGLKLSRLGHEVLLVDFTESSRDPEAKHLPFLKFDLTLPMPLEADVGFCADVMEHIPPESVRAVIENIMACVPVAFFQISTVPDVMGSEIGQDLHLTVRPHSWWREEFGALGFRVAWERNDGAASLFYVVEE